MHDSWLVVDALLQVRKKKPCMMWKTNCPSLLHLFFFSFALFVFWFTIMLLQKAKSEWEGGKEKEREGEGGRGENDRKLDRRTWWRVCEIRKERQTTLLYILEAVGQYLNNSWSTEMDFFFYSGCWTPKAEGLPTFLSPRGQRAASQTAVDHIHLSNIHSTFLAAPPV